MSGRRWCTVHATEVAGVKAACVRMEPGAMEDTGDEETSPSGGGAMRYWAEPIREDGWMWDALVGRGHGAGGAA